MKRGYFTPPVLIILAIIIFAVAILIALNTDLVKRIKKQPSPPPSSSPTTQQSTPSPNETTNWKTYTKASTKYAYSLKYPPNWSYKEEYNATNFFPPEETEKAKSIRVLVVNYKETPPLPFYIKYSTVRTIKTEGGDIEVQKPELGQGYMAQITKGNYTAEFIVENLDMRYDDIFDQILSTFKFLD